MKLTFNKFQYEYVVRCIHGFRDVHIVSSEYLEKRCKVSKEVITAIVKFAVEERQMPIKISSDGFYWEGEREGVING